MGDALEEEDGVFAPEAGAVACPVSFMWLNSWFLVSKSSLHTLHFKPALLSAN